MAAVCEVCGKHPVFGKTYSRLGKGAMNRRIKGRNSRRFDPNIQRIRALVNGSPTRIHVCTGCIKAGKVVKPPMKPRSAS
jgi:large subunit ribosomal protein L28